MDAKNMTSIEWLIENYLPLKRGQELSNEMTIRVIEKAKEMYNQEIIEARIYSQLLYSCQSEKKKEI